MDPSLKKKFIILKSNIIQKNYKWKNFFIIIIINIEYNFFNFFFNIEYFTYYWKNEDQNRAGFKPSNIDVVGSSKTNINRRERQRKLALEVIDPYVSRYIVWNFFNILIWNLKFEIII